MDSLFCSVLIVNYNGGELLVDCVRAVLASSVPVEVLVWDNASTDASMADLEKAMADEPRVHLFRHPDNLGFAGGVNQLLSKAAGDWLLLLNPDCLLAEDTIGQVIAEMRTMPQAGMAGCLIRNPDGSEQAGCRRMVPTPWRSMVHLARLDRIFPGYQRFQNLSLHSQPLPPVPMEVEAISGAFMLVRREALEAVGPLDFAYFMHCEDLDWCMRFRNAGWRIIFVPQAVAVHAKGECSRSRPFFVEWHKHKGMIIFYRKFFSTLYPWPLLWLIYGAVWAHCGLRFSLAILRIIMMLLIADDNGKKRLENAVRCIKQTEQRSHVTIERTVRESLPVRVLVTGATSQIGYFLLPLLRSAGILCLAMSRTPPPAVGHYAQWFTVDLTKDDPFSLVDGQVDCWFHLAKLPLAVPWLEAAGRAGVRRLVAFSTTSIFTKEHSSCIEEKRFVADQLLAEQEILKISARHGLEWTILRPTMIYGCGLDRNISFIFSVIRRFGWFPLVGEGIGLRQPVHAEDLAIAALRATVSRKAANKAYDLAGSEQLTYREMINRLFAAIGCPPRFLPLPLWLARGGLQIIRLYPPCNHLTPAMFERMNMDMVADYSQAAADLDYAPRPFVYE